jgi:NAD-dependent SIR2 family protein deacetylase
MVGAGISTAVGIPDFRSAKGLFSSTGNGKGKGKAQDLFHVRSLTVSPSHSVKANRQSSTLLPAHHALLNELASLSDAADPSTFHNLLSDLDGQGRLLRCYTQNIDGLEGRAGLEIGLPPNPTKIKSPRKSSAGKTESDNQRTPRCIPLHGQLSHLHCPLCLTSCPLVDYLPLPPHPIPCPTCDLSSSIRSALSERQRKVGHVRASVVLYGEEHPQGELIGKAVERDLRGTGRIGEKEGKVDLLLVAGTSLSIPGVKRIVKEMARSLKSRSGGPKVILVNREMPKGAEWQGVFDTFIAGDVQDFARYCSDQTFALSTTTPIPEMATPKKRKATTSKEIDISTAYPTPSPTPARKRPRMHHAEVEAPTTPTKRTTPAGKTLPGVVTPQSLERGEYAFSEVPPSPLSDARGS